jgi:antirestriction protein ArdC
MRTTVKEYYEKLESAVGALLESGGVKEFFSNMAKFRRYSFANQLLIMLQRPGATKVAGMTTWNGLQRRVKKGERGIAVFAPIFRKKESGDSGEEELVGFKTVHVFDISQTEGKDLSCKELQGTTDFVASPDVDTGELTRRLRSACPVPVLRKPLAGMRGYYDPANGVIVLSESLSDRGIPRTLIHEMAHWLAIRTGEHRADAASGERPMGEVVAEAAAFIALSHFGLDTGSISFAYVAGWGRDVKKIVSWGSAAMRVANGLIDLVEGREQNKAA